MIVGWTSIAVNQNRLFFFALPFALTNKESIHNNNNSLHLYSAFLGTQSTLHSVCVCVGGGGSPQPPPVCSIHPNNAKAAILRQNSHHTPAYWWRGDRVMKPIGVWRWLGGHDGQWANLARMPGLHPYSFQGHPGIFNDHRESGPRFNVSSEEFMIACKKKKITSLITVVRREMWSLPTIPQPLYKKHPCNSN